MTNGANKPLGYGANTGGGLMHCELTWCCLAMFETATSQAAGPHMHLPAGIFYRICG